MARHNETKIREARVDSHTSEIYFCRGFSCCPYCRDVRNSEVSARRESTVDSFLAVLAK